MRLHKAEIDVLFISHERLEWDLVNFVIDVKLLNNAIEELLIFNFELLFILNELG
jgi:hypothetical protein